HAQPRAEPDSARVSPDDLDGDQCLAPSHRRRLCHQARRRAAPGRLSQRTADRQLRRRHDAGRGDRPPPDLQRDVGPDPGAGARPGPACYGRGGSEATVTDANVVLGIIDPDYFLGGRIQLDRALAERAVGRVAAQLGTSLVETAYAIHTTSNHNMIAAIEDIT